MDYLLYIASVLLYATLSSCLRVSIRARRSSAMNHVESVENSALFFKDNRPRGTIEAGIGERLVLDCDVGGAPSPTIHWLHNGLRIPQGGFNSVFDDAASYEGPSRSSVILGLGTTKSRLFIDCASRSDEGDYTCVADTPTMRITSNAELKIVKIDPVSGLKGDCMAKRMAGLGSPARVYMWTSHRLELQGVDVQLYCRAHGDPQPRVRWFDRNGTPVEPGQSDYEVLENGDLLIHDLRFDSHMGVYKCVVNNPTGEDSVTTFVYPTTL